MLRNTRSLLLATVVSLPLSTSLQAQRRCTDSLSGASWRSTPLRAVVQAPAGGERDIDRYVDGILPLLAQQYHDPSEAEQGGAAMISVPPESERSPLGAELRVTFDRNGRLLHAEVTRGSGIARVDSAIVLAARAAGSGRGFGKAPRKFRGDTLSVTIAISDRHPNGPRVAPLGTWSTSYLVADVPPRIRSMPAARAPRSKRGKSVMLAGTVNSAGRVVPGSIRVVSTTDSTLIPVARRSFEQAVYRPGTRNGCPAESHIRMNFPF